MKGLVLGAFTEENASFKLTPAAKKFDETVIGELTKNLQVSGVKQGKARLFYRLSPEFSVVAVVGIGKEGAAFNNEEDYEEGKENIRSAASAGCRAMQELEVTDVNVESLGDAESAAEGATLSTWLFQEYKDPAKRKAIPNISLYDSSSDQEHWNSGVIKASAQNLARLFADTPANLMTPTIFCEKAEKELGGLSNVSLTVRDQAWAENMKMGSFLSVSQGSSEPPKFLEVSYKGGSADQNPVVLVGKGVTFDSGGISLKPPAKMDHMRADMSGAACVVATIKALAALKAPVNVVGLTPLTENLPGGKATKPGDVVTAMNGKNIIVDNTDAEGRLILADALCYASSFNPSLTIDIATLTGAMGTALGSVLCGVFSTSSEMFNLMQQAGSITGDRVWRFPLYKDYSKQMTDFPSVDVNNMGKTGGGGACKAAGFLKEFAPKGDWMHMDIAGVMGPDTDVPYLTSGMTGRPVRTLVQFLSNLGANKC